MRALSFCLLFFLPAVVVGVDRGKFKTCEQSGFCKRHRDKSVANFAYHVDLSTVKINQTAIEAQLFNKINSDRLKLAVALLEDSRLRIFIDDANEQPVRQRYHPLVALDGEPVQANLVSAESGEKSAQFLTKKDGNKVVLNFSPFRIDVYSKDDLVISVNSRSLLKFEHFRVRKEGEANEDAFWEEDFKSHRDSKPYGSSSIGLDVSFIGSKFIYGLPEHADSFALKNTDATDPYRLYNLDVFEYELHNPMSLYGAIPYVVAHSKQNTVGALWLNAAETWIDVHSSTADKGVLASIIDKIRPSSEIPQIDTHFISESGVIDLYFMLGPSPNDVFRQNAKLTGVTPIPPLFSIAYHQCRWNYNDQLDVKTVNEKFDEHDIPMDVMWLDIEHTDGKRYFTWDPVKFSNPKEMIEDLEAKSRKLVTIIDPHIKRDDNYFVYKEAKDNSLFVKKSDGETDYDGDCWPGSSMYLDFLNPKVQEFWANKFALDQYKGSSVNLFTWNDMNEPSVFSGPEVTMHKDAKHHGGWEHREVHNIYGQLQHAATYQGHLARSNNQLRPFILTRAFFVGSQRTAAIWTGDNTADWGHLKMSVPMLLTLSVSGVAHVGADVGGFFNNVDEELLVRWYQAGAFQPFFRAHAHIDTKRREPWLYSDEARDAIKAAVKKRYSFLPYWYTLFYEHMKTGSLVMRPLWAEFPEDEASYDEDREWLLGNALLVRPVTDKGATSTSLYLPGKVSNAWYEWNSHRMHISPGAVYVDTPLDKYPLFQRGGTIIPTRERARRASKLMRNDPITLYVAAQMDKDEANGTLYLDDGETFGYEKGEYLYWSFYYKKKSEFVYTITSKCLDKQGTFDPDVYVEKIIIRGVRYYPRTVHIYTDDFTPEDLDFTHDREQRTVVIRKPGGYVSREWHIDIHT